MMYNTVLTVTMHRPASPPVQATFYYNHEVVLGMLDVFPNGAGMTTGNDQSHSEVHQIWFDAVRMLTSRCNEMSQAQDPNAYDIAVKQSDLVHRVFMFLDNTRAAYGDINGWPATDVQYLCSLTIAPVAKEGGV